MNEYQRNQIFKVIGNSVFDVAVTGTADSLQKQKISIQPGNLTQTGIASLTYHTLNSARKMYYPYEIDKDIKFKDGMEVIGRTALEYIYTMFRKRGNSFWNILMKTTTSTILGEGIVAIGQGVLPAMKK